MYLDVEYISSLLDKIETRTSADDPKYIKATKYCSSLLVQKRTLRQVDINFQDEDEWG